MVKASERIDELVNQEDDEEEEEDGNVDNDLEEEEELNQIQHDMTRIVEQAGHRSEEIITQVKKCDDLILKVK